MRIKILSDLHLEHYSSLSDPFNAVQEFIGKGDVLILAGDILNAKHLKTNGMLGELYRQFLKDCSDNYSQVLYVFGNHEFYGYNYEGTFNKIQQNLPNNFIVMENNSVKMGAWNFVGFTFWTDFRKENPLDMMEAHRYMNDYKVIRIGRNYRKLNPDDTLRFNRRSREFLSEQLSSLEGDIFVISHHAPSYRSVPPEFKGNSCNSAYCNEMDYFIMDNPKIKYWAHGHTHRAQDYMIEQCRVICNPHGYPGQDTSFNPNFLLRV